MGSEAPLLVRVQVAPVPWLASVAASLLTPVRVGLICATLLLVEGLVLLMVARARPRPRRIAGQAIAASLFALGVALVAAVVYGRESQLHAGSPTPAADALLASILGMGQWLVGSLTLVQVARGLLAALEQPIVARQDAQEASDVVNNGVSEAQGAARALLESHPAASHHQLWP